MITRSIHCTDLIFKRIDIKQYYSLNIYRIYFSHSMNVMSNIRLHGLNCLKIFTSNFWKAGGRMMDIKQKLSTAFHPQNGWTIGAHEPNDGTILRHVQDDWVEL
jgi:hypothetical protein